LFVFSGNPDILICGHCREMFSDLADLIDHKSAHCDLRFNCTCHHGNGNGSGERDNGSSL
jgi:uncharacterized CHY-type Zn-finger protein